MSLNSLSERKERKLHSPVLSLLQGSHCLSERCVLVVYGPQVAPGGGVHFVI